MDQLRYQEYSRQLRSPQLWERLQTLEELTTWELDDEDCPSLLLDLFLEEDRIELLDQCLKTLLLCRAPFALRPPHQQRLRHLLHDPPPPEINASQPAEYDPYRQSPLELLGYEDYSHLLDRFINEFSPEHLLWLAVRLRAFLLLYHTDPPPPLSDLVRLIEKHRQACPWDGISPTIYLEDEMIQALALLRQQPDPSFLPLLLSLLEDSFDRIRQEAAHTLSALLNQHPLPQSFEPLVALLDDPFWWVREAAVEALGLLGDPRAVQHLQRLQWEPHCQQAVLTALERLQKVTPIPLPLRRRWLDELEDPLFDP